MEDKDTKLKENTDIEQGPDNNPVTRQALPSLGGVGGGLYSTFSTCSLICSNSSFIFTTMFCISA